ncbi:hypothetical protein [Candidatus Chordibacter forsetii]|jgi:hypothetical protein|uniref:hypothetical protein n=1 Tax=Candidatus Chordibacter forsetii TaxID=3381758 RepID=UPI002316F6A0|nr:hypothetical protein [Opitutales bacterium]
MTNKLSSLEASRRENHFKRIIRYRSIFGWVFSGVGFVLFIVGLKNLQNPLVLINGLLFFGYGLFMVWQTKKAKEKMDANL